MGFVLDAIIIKEMISGPVTVTGGYESEVIDISGKEDGFSIEVVYNNGVAANLTFTLHTSVSGEDGSFAPVGDAFFDVTDVSGVLIFDIDLMNTNYVKLVVSGTGSVDVDNATLSAKRRH